MMVGAQADTTGPCYSGRDANSVGGLDSAGEGLFPALPGALYSVNVTGANDLGE